MKTITKNKPKRKLAGFFDRFGKVAEKNNECAESAFSLNNVETVTQLVKSRNLRNAESAPLLLPQTNFDVSRFVYDLQKSGVKFHVSPQFFETGGRSLIETERQTLKQFSDRVLCHLHQAKLTEDIFREHKDFLEQFKYEVMEREAIFLEDETETEASAKYDAVRLVSHEWFSHFFLTGEFNV